MAFLRKYREEIASAASVISIISAIVLIVSVILSVRQFYLTRQAVQAQAIGTSLAHGRSLYDDLSENAELAEKLFGIKAPQLAETVFVQKTLSFFSEQYIYRQGGLIDDETWELVQRDMCQAYQSPRFQSVASPLLDRGDFPTGFTKLFTVCSDAE